MTAPQAAAVVSAALDPDFDIYLLAARTYWTNYPGMPAEMVAHHAQVTAAHAPFRAAIDSVRQPLPQRDPHALCPLCADDRMRPVIDPFKQVIIAGGRQHLDVTP